MTEEEKNIKKQFRREALSRRRALSDEQRACASKAICDIFLKSQLFHEAKSIFAYIPMNDEVQIQPILLRAWEEGKRILIPYVFEKGKMAAVELKKFEDLEHGAYDIPTVAEGKISVCPPEEIHLVIVPGVAFSQDGARMGMGAGFYDRYLMQENLRARLVALAYSCQIYEEIPTEAHDLPVTYLFTELGQNLLQSTTNRKG